MWVPIFVGEPIFFLWLTVWFLSSLAGRVIKVLSLVGCAWLWVWCFSLFFSIVFGCTNGPPHFVNTCLVRLETLFGSWRWASKANYNSPGHSLLTKWWGREGSINLRSLFSLNKAALLKLIYTWDSFQRHSIWGEIVLKIFNPLSIRELSLLYPLLS